MTSQLKCVSADQILRLADAHRVIGAKKRTWSFATMRTGATALVSTPPRYLFRGQTERHVPCYPSMYRRLRSPSKFLRDLSQGDAAKIVAGIAKNSKRWMKEVGIPLFIPPEGRAALTHLNISSATRLLIELQRLSTLGASWASANNYLKTFRKLSLDPLSVHTFCIHNRFPSPPIRRLAAALDSVR